MERRCPVCRDSVAIQTRPTVDGSGTVESCSACGYRFASDQKAETVLGENPFSTPRGTSPHAPSGTIAHFHQIRLLGEGHFGAVWLAEDTNLGRKVALKLPKPASSDASLVREAKTAAGLKHPNIVGVYEVGQDGDQIYIASEYIDGETLREELHKGRPSVERTIAVLTTVARAAQYAHENNIVHRDLKPANILLNADRMPFIADFGIAKQVAVDETISGRGSIVGTIAYMSPEQAGGDSNRVDHRADIYALGVILFEMLTEYRPFRGIAQGILLQKLEEDAPSPRSLVPMLPRDLETICLKALERNPDRRFQSAGELADELERVRLGVPIVSRPVSAAEHLWRWCRRKPGTSALILGTLFSLVFGIVVSLIATNRAERHALETRHALYRADINLVGQLWNSGDVERMREILSRHHGESDVPHGFEWNYYNGLLRPFLQIVNHGDVVVDVAVSADGAHFASAGSDRTIRVWKRSTGQLERTLKAGSTSLQSIDFAPADTRLVSAHSDGFIRLWNPLQHERTIREFSHGGGLTAVCFAPDGSLIASGDQGGTIRLWKTRTGELLTELRNVQTSVKDIRFSDDGRLLGVATKDGTVSFWNTESLELLPTTDAKAQLLCFDFLDGSDEIVTGRESNTLLFFSTESGAHTQTRSLPRGGVGDIEALPGTGRFLAAHSSGELMVFDEQHDETRVLRTHLLTYGLLDLSADGSTLVCGSGDGTVKLLSVEHLLPRDAFWHSTHVRDIAFLSGSSRIAACDGNGAIVLWDAKSGEQEILVPGSGRESLSLAVNRRGTSLVSAGMQRDAVLTDTVDSSIQEHIPLPHSGFSATSFSQSGDQIALGSRSGTIQSYACADVSAALWEHATPDVTVTDIAFSPDDRVLVATHSDGTVLFLNAASGNVLEPKLVLPSGAMAVCFCDQDGRIAVGTQNGKIHIIDPETRNVQRSIRAHSGRVNDVAAFPFQDRLASIGRDRRVMIWDLSSGDQLASIAGHRRQGFAIAVSPDGKLLASAGLAGDIRIWRGD